MTFTPCEPRYLPSTVEAVSWGGTGRYRRIAELARGGMATVFLAALEGPHGFQKLVVMKEMRGEIAGDPDFRRMFVDEARIAARLSHPNVVQTFEVIEAAGSLAIVMEFLDGQTLAKLRQATRSQDLLALQLFVFTQVLAGLEHVHAAGLVHRDVSPQNVLLTYDGEVKLLDFGIVKTADAVVHTAAGTLKGKVGYMAPEQLLGREVDARTDVFAVGVLLWEALTGRRLWANLPEATVLLRLGTGEIPSVASVMPDAHGELGAICARAMAPDPDARFASAADFLETLEDAMTRMGERATRKDVARRMSMVFAETRKVTRERLDETLAQRASSPSVGLLLSGAATTGSVPAVVATTVTPTGSRRDEVALGSLPPPPVAEPGRPARTLFRAAALIGILLGTAGVTLTFLAWRNRAASGAVVGALPGPASAAPPSAAGEPPPTEAKLTSSTIGTSEAASPSALADGADGSTPTPKATAPRDARAWRSKVGGPVSPPISSAASASGARPIATPRPADTADIDLGY